MEEEEELSSLQRWISQMINVNQIKESLNEKSQAYKDRVRAMFEKKVK